MSGKPNAKSDDISNQDLEMYFEIIEEFPGNKNCKIIVKPYIVKPNFQH